MSCSGASPCDRQFCESVCLLSAGHRYSCACPAGKKLHFDRHKCTGQTSLDRQLNRTNTHQQLRLFDIDLPAFGPKITTTPGRLIDITCTEFGDPFDEKRQIYRRTEPILAWVICFCLLLLLLLLYFSGVYSGLYWSTDLPKNNQ